MLKSLKSIFRASSCLLVSTTLVLGSYFFLTKSVLADGTPSNTTITNYVTGSFDSESTSTSGRVQSNDVNTSTASNPKLLLVKRITAINDIPINTFTNDGIPTSANNNPNWPTPSTYLRGDINRANVKPSDRLEYTVYFLSAGNTPITNVKICDLIPAQTTFVNDAYNNVGGGSNLGIAFANSTTALPTAPTSYLTGTFDSDRGYFYPANSTPPSACKSPTGSTLSANDNTNGLVVVDVVSSPNTLPFATSAGVPTASYGFVRFQVKVN